MSNEHITTTKPDSNDQSLEGKLIPIYLPDKFHPWSEKEDARAERYDLSGQGLSAEFVTQLALFFDEYLESQDPHTEEIVDYLWHYATQAGVGDSETAAVDTETILENCRTLLELVRSEVPAQNATIAINARN